MSYDQTKHKHKNIVSAFRERQTSPRKKRGRLTVKPMPFLLCALHAFERICQCKYVSGPFCCPFISYVMLKERRHSKFLSLNLCAIFLSGGFSATLRWFIFFTLMYSFSKSKKLASYSNLCALVCALLTAVSGFITGSIVSWNTLRFMIIAAESAAAVFFYYVFEMSLAALANNTAYRIFSSRDTICLSALFAAMTLGFAESNLCGVNACFAVCLLYILFSGYCFGAGISLSYSIVCGCLLAASEVRPVMFVIVLCVSAFAVSLSANLGRLTCGLIFTASVCAGTYFTLGAQTVVFNTAAAGCAAVREHPDKARAFSICLRRCSKAHLKNRKDAPKTISRLWP